MHAPLSELRLVILERWYNSDKTAFPSSFNFLPIFYVYYDTDTWTKMQVQKSV